MPDFFYLFLIRLDFPEFIKIPNLACFRVCFYISSGVMINRSLKMKKGGCLSNVSGKKEKTPLSASEGRFYPVI